MTQPFADHFSRVAAAYAKFRPTYPSDLFSWIAAAAPSRRLVWDVGCGTGQASLGLAEHFERVTATDASAEQLALAPPHPRIAWRVALAEAGGLDRASADAITVAQALHWFDLPRFWDEVRRVARPGAVVAAWSYGLHRYDDPVLDGIIGAFHNETVGPWWPENRKHVDRHYETLDFPFARLEVPAFAMTSTWTVDQELGYLGSWSATQRMMESTGQDPLTALAPELRKAWGSGTRAARWPLALLAGRVAS
jgi:ubiquinone/menaquinone biosynthesis C-methylase UbiE